MKRFLTGLLASCLLLGSGAFSLTGRAAASTELPAFEEGDVIGFFGDSITHAEYAEVNYTHVLYNYYATHKPAEEMELRNLGVGGALSSHGLEFYEKDPASRGVNKAVLEYGINDLNLYLYRNPDIYEESGAEREENLKRYEENLHTFLERLEADGVEKENIAAATIAVPDLSDAEQAGNGQEQILRQKGFEEASGIVRAFTEERGIGRLELRSPLTELLERLRAENPEAEALERALMQEDMLHLNTTGQIYLAYWFLMQQGAVEDVSRVEIQGKKARTEGAEVSNLHRDDTCLYYDYQAERLPMGISWEYWEAEETLHILDELNREIIRISDLKEDAVYDLYINGTKIGSYAGKDFAEGVNIANMEANPSQQYALTIEQLNRGRRAAEMKYRKTVQDSTDCGSGAVTEEELQAAYETWREEDEAYRRGMYETAQEGIRVTRRVAVAEQGSSVPEAAFELPGRDYKKLLTAAVPAMCIAALLFRAVRRKRKL